MPRVVTPGSGYTFEESKGTYLAAHRAYIGHTLAKPTIWLDHRGTALEPWEFLYMTPHNPAKFLGTPTCSCHTYMPFYAPKPYKPHFETHPHQWLESGGLCRQDLGRPHLHGKSRTCQRVYGGQDWDVPETQIPAILSLN